MVLYPPPPPSYTVTVYSLGWIGEACLFSTLAQGGVQRYFLPLSSNPRIFPNTLFPLEDDFSIIIQILVHLDPRNLFHRIKFSSRVIFLRTEEDSQINIFLKLNSTS